MSKNLKEGVKFTPSKFDELNLEKFKMGIEYEFMSDIPMYKDKELIQSLLSGHAKPIDKTFSDLLQSDKEELVKAKSVNPIFVTIKDAMIEKVNTISDGGKVVRTSTILDAYAYTGVHEYEEMLDFVEFIDSLEEPEDDISTLSDYVDDFFGAYMSDYEGDNVFDLNQYYDAGMGEYIDLLNFKAKGYLEIIANHIKVFDEGGDVDDHELFLALYHIKKTYKSLEQYFNSVILENQHNFVETILQKREITVYGIDDETPSVDMMLRKHGVSYASIVPEEQNQIEVITDTLTTEEGFINLQRMFGMLESSEFYTSKFSGLHVSISSSDFANKEINMFKFFLLMDMDYLQRTFSERNHVANMDKTIRNKVWKLANKFAPTVTDSKTLMSYLLRAMESLDWMDKNVKISFTDYKIMDGRIELRMFGNKRYEYSYKKVEPHVQRAIYTLDLCYDETAHRKEYLQAFYAIVSDVIQEKTGKDIQGFIDDYNDDGSDDTE